MPDDQTGPAGLTDETPGLVNRRLLAAALARAEAAEDRLAALEADNIGLTQDRDRLTDELGEECREHARTARDWRQAEFERDQLKIAIDAATEMWRDMTAVANGLANDRDRQRRRAEEAEAELADARAEIKRHHADFERWEEMAAQGARSLDERKRLAARVGVLEAALHWIDARTIAPHEPKVNLYGFAVWADGALGEISTKAKAALKDDGGE